MKRAWVGIALLAASWLVGLGYYHHADWLVWSILILAGTLLLWGMHLPLPSQSVSAGCIIALLPVIGLTPWPLKIAPILLAAGLGMLLLSVPRQWPAALGRAMVAAGAVLVVQALTIFAYQSFTGRSHELPVLLADLLGWVARCVSIDSAADSGDVALHTMRKLHRLGATWDFFLDPSTLCFLIGGLAFFKGGIARESPAAISWKSAAAFSATILLWLPVRAALMMALVVHRALRVEYDSPVILMDQFHSTWVAMTLLVPPLLLSWRFASGGVAAATAVWNMPPARGWVRPSNRLLGAVGAVVSGVFLLTFIGLWDPAGPVKQGRVLVDEFHSKWEPTQRPFDTQWYGNESGYNYACIYDYLNHFYEMGRVTTPIDDQLLSGCDVLICKVPTERYQPAEVDAIERFVRNGGGLLLVGEHTDVFGTGVSLNDIAGRFGFSFRYDVILDTDTSFKQVMERPLVPHPILQRLPMFDFAVSCSIAPTGSGRAAVLSRSLRGLGPDYHASNFYPAVDDAADERYGAFVQCWATRQGSGRVVAWSDSTVWSNFCTFEPGKAELMMGLAAWLNHRNGSPDLRPELLTLGVMLLALALFLALKGAGRDDSAGAPGLSLHGTRSWWLPILCAGMLGWALALPALRGLHRATLPPAKQRLPMHRVLIDRTVCNGPLSNGGFIDGKPDGFGVFERWILRLGYFTQRVSGTEAFDGDALVFAYPTSDVSADFRAALISYVNRGGKVLVLDSPENTNSTANSLLYPFNLQVNHQTNETGDLAVHAGWPSAHVAAAAEVTGGAPLITVNGKTVAATTRQGQGSVTVIGFGSRFSDPSMGVTGDTIPDDDLTKAYALEYGLFRWIVEGVEPAMPTTVPAATEPATTQSATTEPAATEPAAATQSATTEPGNVPAPVTEPATAPGATEPAATTQSATTEPGNLPVGTGPATAPATTRPGF